MVAPLQPEQLKNALKRGDVFHRGQMIETVCTALFEPERLRQSEAGLLTDILGLDSHEDIRKASRSLPVLVAKRLFTAMQEVLEEDIVIFREALRRHQDNPGKAELLEGMLTRTLNNQETFSALSDACNLLRQLRQKYTDMPGLLELASELMEDKVMTEHRLAQLPSAELKDAQHAAPHKEKEQGMRP